MPKFSVLIPTRNRLHYLRYAVETILKQDYDDWEIVISDNYSEEDVAGYVSGLQDPRVRYVRTDSFVPVTDNWNNAQKYSTGDYILMLGDDDGLLQGYFRTLAVLIEKHDSPEAIYTGAYLFAYPNAMPEDPLGYLRSYSYADFFPAGPQETWLKPEVAREMVRQTMQFRVRFGYNMQFVVISRKYMERIEAKAPFYQSPYPDYYAMNVLMLESRRVLVCPLPLIIIGVTPKSFGSYLFKKDEKQGSSFLQDTPKADVGDSLLDVVLPGSSLNTSWLYAIETLARNYGQEFGLHSDTRRYRFLQIYEVFERYHYQREFPENQYRELMARLSTRERFLVAPALWLLFHLVRLMPAALRPRVLGRLRTLLGQTPNYKSEQHEHRFQNLLEVFQQVQPVKGG